MRRYLVASALFLLFTSGALAQSSDSTLHHIDPEGMAGFGEGIIDYSFSFDGLSSDQVATRMRGSPGMQIESAQAVTRPADQDHRFRYTEEQARVVARRSLGTKDGANWELADSRRVENGFYQFSFERGSAEVDLTVDASSGRLTGVEGDWDKDERELFDESAVMLSGWLIFEDYFGHIDKKSVSDGDTVNFTLTVSELDRELAGEKSTGFQAVEEVEPGNYTVNLDIVQNGEIVFEVDNRRIHVPSNSELNSVGLTNKAVENMTYIELRREVLLLREDKRGLEYRVRKLNNTVQRLRKNLTQMQSKINETPPRETDSQNQIRSSSENTGDERAPGNPQSRTGNSESDAHTRSGILSSILGSIFG